MTYKRVFRMLALVLAVAAGVADRPANAQGAAARKPRVAFLDFD